MGEQGGALGQCAWAETGWKRVGNARREAQAIASYSGLAWTPEGAGVGAAPRSSQLVRRCRTASGSCTEESVPGLWFG